MPNLKLVTFFIFLFFVNVPFNCHTIFILGTFEKFTESQSPTAQSPTGFSNLALKSTQSFWSRKGKTMPEGGSFKRCTHVARHTAALPLAQSFSYSATSAIAHWHTTARTKHNALTSDPWYCDFRYQGGRLGFGFGVGFNCLAARPNGIINLIMP